MGCDLHQRTFFWSKVVRRYVGSEEVCDWPEEFQISTDRYYDFFGLFGNSVRSRYPALDCLHYGLPEELPKTAQASFEHYGQDYHTRSWCLLPELHSSMMRYVDKLKNPAKFLVDDPEGFSEEMFELPEWKCETSELAEYVKRQATMLKYALEDHQFDKIIDPLKTMYVFYFDN